MSDTYIVTAKTIDEAIAKRIGDDVKVTGYYEVDASLNDRARMVESEIRRINLQR